MESTDLRRAGLKVTHPRMRILELLERKSSQHHLSAEDIYRQLLDHGDEIGLATVLDGINKYREQLGDYGRMWFQPAPLLEQLVAEGRTFKNFDARTEAPIIVREITA